MEAKIKAQNKNIKSKEIKIKQIKEAIIIQEKAKKAKS